MGTLDIWFDVAYKSIQFVFFNTCLKNVTFKMRKDHCINEVIENIINTNKNPSQN